MIGGGLDGSPREPGKSLEVNRIVGEQTPLRARFCPWRYSLGYNKKLEDRTT